MTSRLIKTTALLFSTLGLLACQSDNGISADVAGPADIDVQLAPAFGNLVFESPLALIPDPGNSNRYYVVERGGRVFRVDSTNPDDTSRLLYLDISAHVDDTFEGGLLSVALHPAFTDNGKVFVSYTESPQAGSNAALNSVISVLTQDPANGLADIASEQRLLEHAQPQANHNGGHILFGPDSYLYIGFGDGGGGGDPQGNAQNSATLLGSLLRIDVNTASPYAIPADNPL
ncbi:MAG: PQQ-dependent sugar dehydrogenase, partial [Gammaproteobacteria bacterium]|nr:PQQ-dependent sugar dehydrogenase [Gammaproteobacteria bacterium]